MLINLLLSHPFYLNANESVRMARFLIEPQEEKEINYSISLKNDNQFILK